LDESNEQMVRAFYFVQGRLIELIAKFDWMNEKTGGRFGDSLLVIRDDLEVTRKRTFSLEKHWREKLGLPPIATKPSRAIQV
jgi:hypothetical protein